jgi:hypothetical protein
MRVSPKRSAEPDPQAFPSWLPPMALVGTAVAILNLPGPVVFLLAVAAAVAAGLTIADMRSEPEAPDLGTSLGD